MSAASSCDVHWVGRSRRDRRTILEKIMEKIYPRLHVLLARESNKAIIIRRGPSKHTCVIGWDRGTDQFCIGQWFKGKIYHHRSDISPDGKYWIYFALHNRYGQTWTVVAKSPYLKAVDFYTKDDAWRGGGIFLKNDTYWLNDGGFTKHTRQKKGKELKVKKVLYWINPSMAKMQVFIRINSFGAVGKKSIP